MAFPIFDFTNPSVDYNAAQIAVKQMYSYLIEGKGTGKVKPYLKSVLAEINPILTVMKYNSADAGELNNNTRWKANVKTAYLTLYPLTT